MNKVSVFSMPVYYKVTKLFDRMQNHTNIITLKVVDSSGQGWNVQLGSNAYVEKLKWKVEQKSGKPQNEIKLHFNGTELIDGKTLRELGISDGAEIKLVGADGGLISVFVVGLDNKSTSVQIKKDATVEDLFQALTAQRILQPNTVLAFKGKTLARSTTPLRDMGIIDGATLQVLAAFEGGNI